MNNLELFLTITDLQNQLEKKSKQITELNTSIGTTLIDECRELRNKLISYRWLLYKSKKIL
ncbi:MAG: hypothetical protein JSS76_14020 [Bacteroidetes bacterium]|nr:hypothetical protein [Bacteroidota bacterium]